MKLNVLWFCVVIIVLAILSLIEAKNVRKYKAKRYKLPRLKHGTKYAFSDKVFKKKNSVNNKFTYSANNSTSTNPMPNSLGGNRIVGGAEVVPNSLPWQVGLLIDSQEFCGGTLISDKFVLTAAHCVEGAGTIEVMLGAHNIYSDSSEEHGRIELQTKEYIIHPNWAPRYMRNDVALVKLPSHVTFTETIQPIRLAPPKEYEHAGDKLHVSGWGKTSDSSDDISPTLRQVGVVGITNSECIQAYGVAQITSSTICTSTDGVRGSCHSDSGGPLSVVENGNFIQVGVVSFGSADGCEGGYPIAFARLSSFTEWISTVAGILL